MIDLKGSVVLEKNINHSEKSTFSFNDKDLPNGIYLININTEKENWLQKLMIVK